MDSHVFEISIISLHVFIHLNFPLDYFPASWYARVPALRDKWPVISYP
jgi:hypothetical protein